MWPSQLNQSKPERKLPPPYWPFRTQIRTFNPDLCTYSWLLSLHGAEWHGANEAADLFDSIRAAGQLAVINFAKSNKSCARHISSLELTDIVVILHQRKTYIIPLQSVPVPYAQRSLFCIFCHRKSSAAIYRVMWSTHSATERAIGVCRVPRDANLGLWARNVTVAAPPSQERLARKMQNEERSRHAKYRNRDASGAKVAPLRSNVMPSGSI